MEQEKINAVVKAIHKALEAVEQEFECVIELTNVRSETSNSFKVTLQSKMPGRYGESPEQIAFIDWAEYYGFSPKDYLSKFTFSDQTLTFYGFNRRARKYVCLCRDEQGREVAAEAKIVKEKLPKRHLGY